MNPLARMAVAAVVIAVAIGGAVYVLAPPNGGVGGPPAASPTPTVSPSPRTTPTPLATAALPSPSPSVLANDGFVYPGMYVPQFDPPMMFTIDKEVEHNCAPGFRCRGSIDVNQAAWLGLEFGQPKIEVNVFRVDKVNDPAHPGTLIDPPADLATWIASRPGVTVVNPPKPVTVGGLTGTQFDLRIGSKDVPIGPITGITDFGLGLGANGTSRYIVVKVQGHQILIALGTQDPFLASMAELHPLVDSIVWN